MTSNADITELANGRNYSHLPEIVNTSLVATSLLYTMTYINSHNLNKFLPGGGFTESRFFGGMISLAGGRHAHLLACEYAPPSLPTFRKIRSQR